MFDNRILYYKKKYHTILGLPINPIKSPWQGARRPSLLLRFRGPQLRLSPAAVVHVRPVLLEFLEAMKTLPQISIKAQRKLRTKDSNLIKDPSPLL